MEKTNKEINETNIGNSGKKEDYAYLRMCQEQTLEFNKLEQPSFKWFTESEKYKEFSSLYDNLDDTLKLSIRTGAQAYMARFLEFCATYRKIRDISIKEINEVNKIIEEKKIHHEFDGLIHITLDAYSNSIKSGEEVKIEGDSKTMIEDLVSKIIVKSGANENVLNRGKIVRFANYCAELVVFVSNYKTSGREAIEEGLSDSVETIKGS